MMNRSPTVRQKNAFTMLMSSSSKYECTSSKSKKRKISSHYSKHDGTTPRIHFVDCPAGCGVRLLDKEVNDHLDNKCSVLNRHDVNVSHSNVDDERDRSKEKLRKRDVKDTIPEGKNAITDSSVKNLFFDSSDEIGDEDFDEANYNQSSSPLTDSIDKDKDLLEISTKPTLSKATTSHLNDHSTIVFVKQHGNDNEISKIITGGSVSSTNDVLHESVEQSNLACKVVSLNGSAGKIEYNANLSTQSIEIRQLSISNTNTCSLACRAVSLDDSATKIDSEDNSSLSTQSMEMRQRSIINTDTTFYQNDVCFAHTNLEWTSAEDRTRSSILHKEVSQSPVNSDFSIGKDTEDDHHIQNLSNSNNSEHNPTKSSTDSSKVNAFARMMKATKKPELGIKKNGNKQFALSPLITKHRLHLNEDFSISLFRDDLDQADTGEYGESQLDSEAASVAWSSTVNVKVKNDSLMLGNNNDRTQDYKNIALTVSSSIPSHGIGDDALLHDNENLSKRRIGQKQLVRNHSKLSVSVLKSILQKSIRRRRPLPSVRVAMEFIDKSMTEFLRRLPVIILEDSTLHPDYGFIVWLMIANSKDYIPSPRLIDKLLRIVYEVASCPWMDRCDDSDVGNTWNKDSQLLLAPASCHTDSLHSSTSSKVSSGVCQRCTDWVYCILLRSEYGGMQHDVEMLRGYALTWHRRLNFQSLTSTLLWSIHESGMKQSVKRIPLHDVDHLTIQDICCEGIDFHCSRILEFLLLDENYCDVCLDLIRMMQNARNVSIDDSESEAWSMALAPHIAESGEARQAWWKGLLKQIIWKFSSSVNYRRPLLSFLDQCVLSTGDTARALPSHDTKNRSNDNDRNMIDSQEVDDHHQIPLLEWVWNQLFANKVKAYQLNYVQERVVAAAKKV